MTTWLSSATGAVELRYSLPFVSCCVYAPRGDGLLSAGARLLCRRVKASDPLWLPRYARWVAELTACQRSFAQMFGAEAWLVPVPGSTTTAPRDWAAWQLATALHQLGLAAGVWPGLTRQRSVRKSATALHGERPTVQQHFASFSVGEPPRPVLERIVLVDDVVTRGRTLLAAAARLRGSLPHADIRAFAMVRTLGFASRVDRLVAPCEGFVYWACGDARREP